MELVPAWSNPNTGTSFSAVTIRTFNSQAAKQCNGKLKSIRTQVAYMRQDNYLKYVRYFLHKKNRAILKAATKWCPQLGFLAFCRVGPRHGIL